MTSHDVMTLNSASHLNPLRSPAGTGWKAADATTALLCGARAADGSDGPWVSLGHLVEAAVPHWRRWIETQAGSRSYPCLSLVIQYLGGCKALVAEIIS